ncbi:MAG: Ig-like domain-containing protein [Candidatus Aminicenantes bacterium]|nr:Ig-like domain-containing protein [Candidatus Aminicenantes bacterium]
MPRIITAGLTAALVCAALLVMAQAQGVSVESLPPSVIKTVPTCGDTHVDPKNSEVKVTFSKDMMTDEMWSWIMYTKDTFPEIDAAGIKYLPDNRTCILPVKLKPDKTYVIWINSQQNNAFRDLQGNPAIPYLLVFRTKS